MKGTFFCTSVLFISSLVSSPAWAGIWRHDRSNIQHINLAQEARYQSVGRFNWEEVDPFSGDTFSFLGSGVLISPEWVLTAGHVVGGNDNAGGGVSNFNFTIGGVEIPAAERIVHHAWTETAGDLFAGWDLGLVRLSQPVFNASPAALYQGDDELGQVGTIVGYGSSGTGQTGNIFGGGDKRAGNNIIDAIGTTQTPGGDFFFNYTHDRLLSVDLDNPLDQGDSSLGSSDPLDLEYGAAPGDSGGGLFIEEDGQTYVAGITSLGRTDFFDQTGLRFDYGEVTSYIRVNQFIGWIEDETGLTFASSDVDRVLGDFDGDGQVTASDYDRWQSEFGRSSGVLTADANGDGVVNNADYSVWRSALANSASSAAASFAVPEPTACVLLASAMTLALGRRQRAE